ncbi:signal peptidase I [Halobaculum sp. EA56]|uniref:signal peptidase I n=1 Tax=Halobaculum sp. EA56 TaxID=3421648 RepID=UPI003EC0FE5C
MAVRTIVEKLFLLVVLTAVLSLVLGAALGQPILLSYVETGSMQPTLEAGDGFIAVPKPLAAPVEEGDVIVFEAERIQGGGLTTHRVVDITDQGYITKGDNNPFTDQSNGEPPVKPAQVVAIAWSLNGKVVVIPYLGIVFDSVQSVLGTFQGFLATVLGTGIFLGTKGLAYLFFVCSLIWYVIAEWRDKGRRDVSRTREQQNGIDIRIIIAIFALLIVVGANTAMIGPSGTDKFSVVSAEFESERPLVIPAGESTQIRYPVGSGGVIPHIVFLEPGSEGVTIEPQELQVRSRSVANATVKLQAPPEIGYYPRYVVKHHYLALLPLPIIRALYQLHPWAPIIVIDAMLGIPFYLLGIKLAGTGRVRNRTRDRDRSVVESVRRKLQNLYR